MSLPVLLRAEARDEFDAAVDWYETRRSGLGAKFADAVQNVLDRIEAFPEAHATIQGDIRQALVAHFPYLVLYQVKPDHVVVLALIHGQRDLGSWLSRN